MRLLINFVGMTKLHLKYALSAVAMFLAPMLTSCDNFEYHPYSADIDGPVGLTDRNIAEIKHKITSLPLTFAFITDTQGSDADLKDALKVIKTRGDIDFIVHGGDQTDFGLTREFLWCRDIMEKCGLPYITVIGNHDSLGNGEEIYKYVYGVTNYSFDVAGVHFVCLNTNALEYDYSEPVPDLGFITADAVAAKEASATQTVVVMHSHPYDEQFNNNVADPFLYYLRSYPGMGDNDERREDGTFRRGFCVNGHNHSFDVSEIGSRGILFYQCANIAKRQFFVFAVTSEGYEMEKVDF